MSFLGMIICFTGRFDGFVKKTAEALVLAGGGCCVGEVSKKVGTRAARCPRHQARTRWQDHNGPRPHVRLSHTLPPLACVRALSCSAPSRARPRRQGQRLLWLVRNKYKTHLRVYVKEQGDSLLTRRFITERESTGRTAKEPLAFLLPPAQRHGLQRARGGTRCTVCSPTATSWRAHLWA